MTNLSDRIREQLPAGAVVMRLAGEAAQAAGLRLFLVGGVVRDLLLNRANLDIDLVVEGDAIALARELARKKYGKVIAHRAFGTAKIEWDGSSADLATARRETYAQPGALPTIEAGSIETDLFRRDFTINAMAIELDPARYGEVIDLYQGRADLERGLIRVLHERSFTDDATRIWRAIRYEQRLDFNIEPATLALLRRDTAMLDTISGDRIRHELELVLKEELPEKALRRADELGVLARMHPALKADKGLADRFAAARRLTGKPPMGLYLALLAYRLGNEEIEQVASYLKLPRTMTQVLRDTIAVRENIEPLNSPQVAPSRIYNVLHGRDTTAITANLLAAESPAVRRHIELYLEKLRYVKTALIGTDLKKMGLEGHQIREVLDLLREARLDGKVGTRGEEEGLVRQRLGRG